MSRGSYSAVTLNALFLLHVPVGCAVSTVAFSKFTQLFPPLVFPKWRTLDFC